MALSILRERAVEIELGRVDVSACKIMRALKMKQVFLPGRLAVSFPETSTGVGFGFLDELDKYDNPVTWKEFLRDHHLKIEVFVQRFDAVLTSYCYGCIALPATAERNGKKSDSKLKDLSVAVVTAALSLVSGCGSLGDNLFVPRVRGLRHCNL